MIDLEASREEAERLAAVYHRGCLKALADIYADFLRKHNPPQEEAERIRQAHVELMEEVASYDEELEIQ